MAKEKTSPASAIVLLLLFAGVLWASWNLSGNGNSAKAIFEQGRKRSHAGDWKGAIPCFTRVIEMDPKFSTSYDYRAMAERELMQYDKAISDCDRAIQINPTDYFPFLERGLSEAGKGDCGSAIMDYLRAIRLNPTNSYAFSKLAEADSQLLNFNEAIVCLTRAIELNPTNSVYYNNRGWAEFLHGDFESAITDATHSIQLDPKFGDAYGTRGWARFKAGDIAGAVEDCKRAIQLGEPGSAECFCDQGLLDFIAKDYKKAVVSWQEEIKLRPDLKRALQPWIGKAQEIEGVTVLNSSNSVNQIENK